MLGIIGDIHGVFRALPALLAQFPADMPVLQVGDFGYWPELAAQYRHYLKGNERVIHVIDGNHDHVLAMLNSTWPDPAWPNVRVHQRGDVVVFNDIRVLFFGGATSVDRAWRPMSSGPHAWFPEEIPTDEDVSRALSNAYQVTGVDLIVAHTPPDEVIRRNFSEDGLRMFGHNPATWEDVAARRVQYLWKTLGQPDLVCGHMHRSVVDDRCRILDINETMVWAPMAEAV